MKLMKSISGILVLLVVLEFAGLVGLGVYSHAQNQKINALDEKFQLFQINNAALVSSERPVVDNKADFVYLPELHIKLPYNNITKLLTYSLRGEGDGTTATEADVSSVAYMPPQGQTVISCSDLVRLKIEPTPKPYNPHEKPASIPLGDGRILQVYEHINVPECQQSWTTSMLPSVVAGAFTEAAAY